MGPQAASFAHGSAQALRAYAAVPHACSCEQPALTRVSRVTVAWVGSSGTALPHDQSVQEDQMSDRLSELEPYAGPEIPPERAAVPFYRLLVHAPRLIPHWYEWVEGLRWDVEAPRHYREMMLLRTVQLNGGEPAWSFHAPGAGEFGITDEQLAEMKRWRISDAFDEKERAVLRCCDEVHEMALSKEAFGELQKYFTDGECVELVVTTAFYQCVPRVMQGLGAVVDPAAAEYTEMMR